MKKLFIFIACLGLIACNHKKKAVEPILSSDYKKADSLWSAGKTDSAFYYFDKATSNSNDSLEIAMSYNYMAYIQSNAGDYYGAQESLISSLKYLKETNPAHLSCLSSDYNELGMANSSLQDYDSAIDYFDLALKYTTKEAYRSVMLNNKANAYRGKKEYYKALAIYHQVYQKTEHNGKDFARLLTNMAIAKWKANPDYNPVPELLTALNIRKQSKDKWGQNSSYSHIADYYSTLKLDSGFFYAKRWYSIARELKAPNDQMYALKLLVKLSPGDLARSYFSSYEQLNDSIQTARNTAKNQFALIRYHAEKSKADNLQLQKDILDQKYKLIQHQIWIFGLLLVFGIAVLLSIFWYKKRKQRIEQEKLEAIKESQRKASKIVHDTLANDLYRIMKTIQYGSEFNQDSLVDNLDDVYQRARDLSYDITPDAEDYELRISVLLKSFASDHTKVVIVGNSPELWQEIAVPVKIEIKYILQELMVNMKKHSEATNVVIKFEKQGIQRRIIYMDDGIGLSDKPQFNNGLTNTESRINSFGGHMTFGKSVSGGLRIDITFEI